MADLELEGRIKTKLAVQQGTSARGEWARQDFVLEYQDGSFPAEACFTAWGKDKVAELGKYNVGDEVKVSFNVRAREYSGRWYNDLRVWRLTPKSRQQAGTAPEPPAPSFDDLPPMESPEEDDLPF